jgi:geranylgeranyl diphosphate synthase type II
LKLKDYLKKEKVLIDRELERLTPQAKEPPQVIHKAIRYSIKGGKRIRPILCLSSARASGGKMRQALKAACAIEMIHSYSLIHDDLPSMDNSDYRRGRPSCHKKFGIANAILAGDALLTLAFGVLAEATKNPVLNSKVVKELATACGTFGMIGGQVVDISQDEKDLLTLEYINIHKTGALIAASCKIGAMATGAKEKDINSLFRFGEYIGLAFQIVDDILDGEGVVKIYGPKRAYEQAAGLINKAKKSISSFGKKADMLYKIADLILNRRH